VSYYQIPAELIKAGDRSILSDIHKLINSTWNMKDLPGQWMQSTIGPIYKKDNEIKCSDLGRISLLSTIQNVIQLPFGKIR
jgi:hypothetical protein